jgi:hypothetical protein
MWLLFIDANEEDSLIFNVQIILIYLPNIIFFQYLDRVEGCQ